MRYIPDLPQMVENSSEIMLTCTPHPVNAIGAQTKVFIRMRRRKFRG
jgi:hypothetical protein